jgi:hypothetical protein
VLLVTTSERADGRFAHQAYLAHQRLGTAPLLIFLTTTNSIQGCREGVLGPIWRSATEPWANPPARVSWLHRLHRCDPPGGSDAA